MNLDIPFLHHNQTKANNKTFFMADVFVLIAMIFSTSTHIGEIISKKNGTFMIPKYKLD